MPSRLLTIEILEAWSAGSGRGEGSYLDAVPVLDEDRLPYLPGRTLKGLLRDAVWCQEQVGGCPPDTATLLFGTRERGQDRYATHPGLIRVDSARLPLAIRSALRSNPDARSGLFCDVFRTAIDERTGTARNKSLRSARLAVPMTLHAQLSSLGEVDEKLWAALEAALAWLDGVGSGRTRGLGRCIATLGVGVPQPSQESAHE